MRDRWHCYENLDEEERATEKYFEKGREKNTNESKGKEGVGRIVREKNSWKRGEKERSEELNDARGSTG